MEFLDEIKEMSLGEMVATVRQKKEILALEVRDLKHQHTGELFHSRLRLYQDIKDLLFLLENQAFPDTLHPEYLGKYRWIIEKLVNKKQLNSDILRLFVE
jgi:hypothetical protein